MDGHRAGRPTTRPAFAKATQVKMRFILFKIDFAVENNEDPDDSAIFHLGFLCLQKYLFSVFQTTELNSTSAPNVI